jgi:hypothetical protein
MGDVKKVLLGECCADKDTQKVTPQKERGIEKKKRRQEEMLTQEVFFPKQSEARYNPNRIIDLARPNANNQAAKRESTGRAKTELDWQIYRASQTPAPGDHTLPSTFSKLGAKISKGSFKTELDWIQTNGPKVPGPGAYDVDATSRSIKGGMISKGNPKSDVDWRCYHASQMPGPGNYALPSTLTALRGGRFNESEPKSALDWEIHRASQVPGAGAYDSREHKVSGGRFNHATASKYSKAELEAIRSPGPGSYSVPEGLGMSRIGGRFAPQTHLLE